jgi:hypothetical protein
MELRIPRLPFSLDPQIAEAKRRANRRRLLLAGLLVVLMGGAIGATLALRSPPQSHQLTLPPSQQLGIERIPGMTKISDSFVPGASSCPTLGGTGKAVLPRFEPVQWSFCGSGWFSGMLQQTWVSSAAVAAEGVGRLRQRVGLGGARLGLPLSVKDRPGPVEVQVTVLSLLSWPGVEQKRSREARQIVPTGYSEQGATFTPLPRWAINGGVARQIHAHYNEGLNRFQFIWAAGTHIVLAAVYGGSRLTLNEAQRVAALAGPSQ